VSDTLHIVADEERRRGAIEAELKRLEESAMYRVFFFRDHAERRG
jgi:hypothetical protein